MCVHVFKGELGVALEQQINAFIEDQSFRTVFQSPAYYHFYRQVALFDPLYLIVRDENGRISGSLLAVMIREGNGVLALMSRRCVVYGGPIVAKDNALVVSVLLAALNKHVSSKALFTQFRNFRAWPVDVMEVFGRNGYIFRERLNLLVDISVGDQIIKGFSESRRRQLRRALAAGVEVVAARDENEVEQLYKMLYMLYRHRVKKPLPPLVYFTHFFNYHVKNNTGVVLLVKAGGELIGGIVSPVTPGYSISELYVCGLDKEFPHYHPSVVATWAAMDYGNKMGLEVFDFMGLGRPDVPYGVRDFKLRFGGEQVNFGRFARRNNKLLYLVAEMGYNFWRMLRGKR
jgi:serine/alanine adding enzyme